MAGRSSLVVRFRIRHFLVAYVAEIGGTFLAFNQILGRLFAVYFTTVRTLDAQAYIDVWIFVETHKLLDHLLVDLSWQLFALVRPVRRVLFVVLVPFGRIETVPAEELKTLGALNLGATAAKERDTNATFRVWAKFGALFNVKLVQS